MFEFINNAVVSFNHSPVEFLMGPALLPIFVSVTFIVLALAFKVATAIENKLK